MAVADVVSTSPRITAVPLMITAAVAAAWWILLAVAAAVAPALAVAETYFIAAGPTVAVATDAVRFADDIAPVSSDLLA